MLEGPATEAAGLPRVTAERAQEVRERAEPGQGEPDVEPMVLRHRVRRVLREVVLLVLNHHAAALGVVVPDNALVHHHRASDVVIERVSATEPVRPGPEGGAGVEELVRAIREERELALAPAAVD